MVDPTGLEFDFSRYHPANRWIKCIEGIGHDVHYWVSERKSEIANKVISLDEAATGYSSAKGCVAFENRQELLDVKFLGLSMKAYWVEVVNVCRDECTDCVAATVGAGFSVTGKFPIYAAAGTDSGVFGTFGASLSAGVQLKKCPDGTGKIGGYLAASANAGVRFSLGLDRSPLDDWFKAVAYIEGGGFAYGK